MPCHFRIHIHLLALNQQSISFTGTMHSKGQSLQNSLTTPSSPPPSPSRFCVTVSLSCYLFVCLCLCTPPPPSPHHRLILLTLSVCLNVSPVCLSIYLSFFFCLSFSACLSDCISVSVCHCLSVCPHPPPPPFSSLHLSLCQSA